MEDSPIKYLDNDLLTYMLPKYVAKMRKKKCWENLMNKLVYCYKGVYDYQYINILDNKFPLRESQIKEKMFNYSSILSNCEDDLEAQFNIEYNKYPNERFIFEPNMDKDFIPFYNLFKKLTGTFDTSMLSDFRMNNKYPALTRYYEYLREPDNYIKTLKKENDLRRNLKDLKMNTRSEKEIAVKRIFDIDLRRLSECEKNKIIKEKCDEIKRIKKSLSYKKKLTDKDKEWLTNVLKEYYYIMSVTNNLGYTSIYDIPKCMRKIKKNIIKIESM